MFAGQGWLGICGDRTLVSSKSMSGFLELGDCMGEPWKRIEERRQHMGKVARMCGDCCRGGRRLSTGTARVYGAGKHMKIKGMVAV